LTASNEFSVELYVNGVPGISQMLQAMDSLSIFETSE
jgi:hypothetical protein